MFHFFGIYLSIRSGKLIYLTDIQQLPRSPFLMGSLICSLAAMSGLPPFLGFWGKLGVIFSLLRGQEYILGFIGLAGGLFLLYFYFQNYRFIGVIKPGLIYRPIYSSFFNWSFIVFIGGGILVNCCFAFFVMDLYG